MTQHPTEIPTVPAPPPPVPPTTVYAARALATPPIQAPPEVKQVEAKAAEEKPPTWTFVYYFRDGGVAKLVDVKPDSILFEQAYLVMVSVPARHNKAPYVEVIKMQRHGSIIMSANVPVPHEPQGGDNGEQQSR